MHLTHLNFLRPNIKNKYLVIGLLEIRFTFLFELQKTHLSLNLIFLDIKVYMIRITSKITKIISGFILQNSQNNYLLFLIILPKN